MDLRHAVQCDISKDIQLDKGRKKRKEIHVLVFPKNSLLI